MSRIHSINISPGGIPKRPVDSCAVSFAGLAGDGHNHEKHRTPLQAVSLLDLEMLDVLRAEGFPVDPGATGENVTLSGAGVQEATPGDLLRFEGGLVLELTKRRKPCYVLDAIDPRLKEAAVGRLGMLAKVLCPATIRRGEGVELVRGGCTEHSQTRGEAMVATRDAAVGVLLAGGESRRFGRPKHGLELADGMTMGEHVAGVLASVCGRVVVAGPAEVLPALPHVRDREAGRGPLAGIEAALEAEASRAGMRFLIVPCDLPLVPGALLERLLVDARAPMTIFAVEGEEEGRPLPCALAASALPTVRRLLERGDLSVRRLAAELEAHRVVISAAEARLLEDVDTPEDGRRLVAGHF